ncbi:unnamed protein product [Cylicocyclus nassatus]|uniref:CTP synthase N-terminal domain-containing protein n=1 Tax=Cylicocyclus nassatus TaxID=53992 RepID=A0AA36HG18_CYLNA|nr:unnamed protein product [Cylicocyclus nassatus]
MSGYYEEKLKLQVTDSERLGDYCGETVHLIPHFTDAVIQWVEQVARIPVDGTLERPDVCIIEVASLPCGEGNGLTVLQQKETRRKKEVSGLPHKS